MKKQLLALVGLGLLLATASASAQTVPLKANVPFNFIVNKAELPAGEYTLKSLGSGTAMLIQSADSQIAKLVLPNACESSKAQRPVSWFSTATAHSTSWLRSGRQDTSRARNCQRAAVRLNRTGLPRSECGLGRDAALEHQLEERASFLLRERGT